MGYEPDEVTYASDYFEELMQMALKLVKEGKAYVCNASREQMHEERQNRQSNSERELPVEHSLKHFPELQPHQTLRLKLDPTAPNPTLRDPVIYRTKEKPHPRTLNRYRIYPTYDFTHCISDSIEHIDYSLCSL
jgi:glutaminyl-tRNA synthetase